ncbi:MAG: hypothetical protein ABJH04_02205 [Cyclobacteriaceae bacterium]
MDFTAIWSISSVASGLVYLVEVKMKFSNKDLVLLFGVLIAVIVALTIVVYSDMTETPQKAGEFLEPTTSIQHPSAFLRKAIDEIKVTY